MGNLWKNGAHWIDIDFHGLHDGLFNPFIQSRKTSAKLLIRKRLHRKWKLFEHRTFDGISCHSYLSEELLSHGLVQNFMGYLLKKRPQVSTSQSKEDIRKILRGSFILAHPLFHRHSRVEEKHWPVCTCSRGFWSTGKSDFLAIIKARRNDDIFIN